MSRAKIAGFVVLAVQLVWVAHEQLGSSRYFCWAPLHEHVWYRVEAQVGGKALSDDQIAARYGRRGALYHRSARGFWELNAAQHVLDSLAWRERTLPPEQRATVSVLYRINDRGARTWTYTP